MVNPELILKVTEARRAARKAAGSGGKHGRPIDPASRRQQKLAQRALDMRIPSFVGAC